VINPRTEDDTPALAEWAIGRMISLEKISLSQLKSMSCIAIAWYFLPDLSGAKKNSLHGFWCE
jgi:hypothetical protein